MLEDDLEVGKAAEHLVCYDLIMQGYRAFLSDQGLNYDVILDHNNRLYRIQVKSTQKPRNCNSQGKNPRFCYSFSVRRKGKKGYARLSDKDCDIIALVGHDIKAVAYFPIKGMPQTVQLHHPEIMPLGGYRRKYEEPITKYPIRRLLDA